MRDEDPWSERFACEPIGGGSPLTREAKAQLIPVLRHHPGVHVVLASASEERVGLAVCFLGLSTFAARPLLNLQDLVVLPKFRGRGVGSVLLHAVEERARLLGCCKLTLEVRADNVRARRLHRGQGFREFAAADLSMPVYFLDKPL